jgi:formate dehydrogenase major subunit
VRARVYLQQTSIAWVICMIKEIFTRWPLMRQIFTGTDGTGAEAMSERSRTLRPRHHDAQVSRSVCPYCAVGCGQLVYHKSGKLISIEGDPESPISRGRLCPKGSDSFELLTHPNRETKVKYRRPYSTTWEDLDLERAMDMIADRVWDTRERTFEQQRDGEPQREQFSGGPGVPDSGQMRVFQAERKRIPKTKDSLAERGEFGLSGDFISGQ